VRGRQFLPGSGVAAGTKAAKQGFSAGAIFASGKAMPAYDFNMNKAGLAALQAAPASSAVPTASESSGFSLQTAFHDLLEIVNPLQHLPVVGTLYRAITHDTIGTVEKIAGDTLYGGMWGAIGSVADVAFEAATGKEFGATVLALFTGDGTKPAAVAAATPPTSANTAAAQASSQASGADVVALSNSLIAKGVNGSLSARALFAYQQSQSLGTNPQASSLVAVN
jgi:hypothetical protein